MKGRTLVLCFCILSLFAIQTHASVFSGSSGNSLQGLFNNLGYQHIDVANYQTDLNFALQGAIEFQLLSRSGVANTSFGVLEGRQRSWGTSFRHKTVLGRSAGVGQTAIYRPGSLTTNYGFYISKPDPYRWWRQRRYYSYSPFNKSGSVQALFYQDPEDSGSYLIAFNGSWTGDSHASNTYDKMVVRMRIRPAPEPATWVLLASGLIGVGVLYNARRKQRELG